MYKKNNKGFTLVESLVYIGLFALITLIVVQILFSEIQAWGHARAERNAVDAGRFAIERLTQEIRLASSVNSSTSMFGTHPGVLALNTYQTPTSTSASALTIDLDGSELTLARDAASPASITGEHARISNLVFRHLTASSTEAIRIELTIESGNGRYEKEKTFTTVAVLRGDY